MKTWSIDDSVNGEMEKWFLAEAAAEATVEPAEEAGAVDSAAKAGVVGAAVEA